MSTNSEPERVNVIPASNEANSFHEAALSKLHAPGIPEWASFENFERWSEYAFFGSTVGALLSAVLGGMALIVGPLGLATVMPFVSAVVGFIVMAVSFLLMSMLFDAGRSYISEATEQAEEAIRR